MRLFVSLLVTSELISMYFANDQFCKINQRRAAEEVEEIEECGFKLSKPIELGDVSDQTKSSLHSWFHTMQDYFQTYQKEWTNLVEKEGRTVSPPSTKSFLNAIPNRKELKLKWNEKIKKFKASKANIGISKQDHQPEIQGYKLQLKAYESKHCVERKLC